MTLPCSIAIKKADALFFLASAYSKRREAVMLQRDPMLSSPEPETLSPRSRPCSCTLHFYCRQQHSNIKKTGMIQYCIIFLGAPSGQGSVLLRGGHINSSRGCLGATMVFAAHRAIAGKPAKAWAFERLVTKMWFRRYGCSRKMDGENNGSKPYSKMDDLGGFTTPIFGVPPI